MGDSLPTRRIVWALIAAGTAARLVVAFATYGDVHDLGSLGLVGDALLSDPLHVYSEANGGAIDRWPYPSGAFPLAAAAAALNDLTGLPFHGLVQIGPIAADAAIAWLVQDGLRRRGAARGTRIAATAAVALGPSFAIISGYQSQFDSLAILPALGGLLAWERMEPDRRAAVAGVLIGLGAAMKITPGLVLLALLPTAISWREAVRLCLHAAGVVVLLMAPFLAADLHMVLESAGYSGIPGVGGITLVLQPDLADNWLRGAGSTDVSRIVGIVAGHDFVANAAVVALLCAILLRYRPVPAEAAVLIWLTVYVFATGFFFQYMVWGLPFFILAGHVRKVALLQAALLPPAIVFYSRPWEDGAIVAPYSALMIAVWVGLAAALAFQLRRVVE